MSPRAQHLLDEVMRLPSEERAELASALHRDEAGFDPAVEAEWAQEIQRRIEDIESGRVKTISWDEADKMIFGDEDEAAA